MLQSICLHLHINRANLTTFLFIRKMQIFITVHPYSTLVFLFCVFISLSCFSLAFLSLAHSPCSCLLIDKVFCPVCASVYVREGEKERVWMYVLIFQVNCIALLQPTEFSETAWCSLETVIRVLVTLMQKTMSLDTSCLIDGQKTRQCKVVSSNHGI